VGDSLDPRTRPGHLKREGQAKGCTVLRGIVGKRKAPKSLAQRPKPTKAPKGCLTRKQPNYPERRKSSAKYNPTGIRTTKKKGSIKTGRNNRQPAKQGRAIVPRWERHDPIRAQNPKNTTRKNSQKAKKTNRKDWSLPRQGDNQKKSK